MPILVDYNHLILAAIFRAGEMGDNSEEAYRAVFLKSLLHNKKKFKEKFGNLVICADNPWTWRRQVFPYYKQKRKEAKAADVGVDWNFIHEFIGKMLDDLREYFPYKVLKVDLCEADDIIGTVCTHYGKFLNNDEEQFLILSRDHDFQQLHQFSNVSQYAPTKKEFIVEPNPAEFLEVMIIKGDKGDGIPNILSADDSIVQGIRATTMTKKRIDHYKNPENRALEPEIERRWQRNKMLIDFTQIPKHLQEEIIKAFDTTVPASRKKLQEYFMKYRLKNFAADIQDF